PDKWERFVAPIPEGERGDLLHAYRRILTGGDPTARIAAAKAWSVWEGETIRLLPDDDLSATHEADDFALAFARIENHYFVHGGWLEEGQLIRDAGKLRAIPGVIVQGRYDMACPAETAWELHRAWPQARFEMIEGAGHAYNEPGIWDALVRATDDFAS
ncbi:MAG: prolyl aminopeptidase, partial [Sphingobium sp.]